MTNHRPWSEMKNEVLQDPERAARISAMKAAQDSGFVNPVSDELLQEAADVARSDQEAERANDIYAMIDNVARSMGEKICPDCGGRGWKTQSGLLTSDLSNVMVTCPTCLGDQYVPLSRGN